MALFNNDEKKVKELDKQVSKKMGFDKILPVAGQIYTRKIDSQISDVLSGIAQSAHKLSNDIRLLHNLREIEEPFGKKQIGSSAMPYKRKGLLTILRTGDLCCRKCLLQQTQCSTLS
jgi:adenylosuccinate lyase